jgi:protein MAK11
LVSKEQPDGKLRQVGSLLATQETGDRITCLGAFPLDGKALEDTEDDFEGFDGENQDDPESSGEEDE